jgi:hypothetical protein
MRDSVRLPTPKPRVILPRYSDEDVFGLFARFLQLHGFSYTQAMLVKELEHQAVVSWGSGGTTPEAAALSEVRSALRVRI